MRQLHIIIWMPQTRIHVQLSSTTLIYRHNIQMDNEPYPCFQQSWFTTDQSTEKQLCTLFCYCPTWLEYR